MESKTFFNLIHEAQTRLVNTPQDPFHDITHHYRVLENACHIMDVENLRSKVDPELVEVVCWWHDIYVSDAPKQGDERIVKTTARYVSGKLPSKLSHIVFDAIGHHEFGDSPESLEGKILQDADKLEVISCERVGPTVSLLHAGLISQEKVYILLDILENTFLPNMQERYHFESSRQKHVLKLPAFNETMSNLKTRLSTEFNMTF